MLEYVKITAAELAEQIAATQSELRRWPREYWPDWLKDEPHVAALPQKEIHCESVPMPPEIQEKIRRILGTHDATNGSKFNRDDYVFLRRTEDGKFYRGADWWRWTKSWRRAALLPVYFWRCYVLNQRLDGVEVEFVGLNDIGHVL